MDEIEVPTEHLHEAIKEGVEEESSHGHKQKGWSMLVAISTAMMAVFAAISSLLAGHHSNEALIEQIKSSDQWSFYQAKGIKAELKTLELNFKQANADDVTHYKTEQEALKEQAEEFQQSSVMHIQSEKKFAVAVTFFQIAIAVAAIAILSKKKFLWVASLFIGSGGLVFLIIGIMLGHF